MSWPDYEKHCFEFFNRQNKDSIILDEIYLFHQAKFYISKIPDFKYKDHVEAATLLSSLAEKGLIAFLGYNSKHEERYVLTKSGSAYLDSLQKK